MKRRLVRHLVRIAIVTSAIFCAGPSWSATVYVDSTATGANNGTSWANAFTSVQNALTAALSGDAIWVANGTYYPTTTTNRTLSFQLKAGVTLYGGFAGNETLLSQRNWVTNLSILSGDIGVKGIITDNSYHVVRGDSASSTAAVNGFTISRGRADGLLNDARGGGVYLTGGNQTLANLTITLHDANELGGGIYCSGASPTLTSVMISINDAFDLGGGMYVTNSSQPVLTNVTFSNNDADDGGGLYSTDSRPKLTNVVFTGNSADFNGGGMFNVADNPTLINVVFDRNSAGDDGGGLYNFAADDTLVNVTFSGNTAGVDGGAIYNFNSFPKFVNTVIWGNVATIGNSIFNNSSTPHISYCIVEGSGGSANWDASLGTNGGNNLDADADFVNPGIGDVHLDVCSAAINTGNNAAVPGSITTDLGGGARILFVTVDMGAYESLVPPGLRVYVKKNATGLNNGTSWANAFTELRDALTASLCSQVDIWVAVGTYKPTATTTRTISFQLRNGLALYGGYAGTETLLSQRNVLTNVTILSGDIGVPADSTDNSNRILAAGVVDTTAILDGFTVAYGNGRQGAGLANNGGSPKVRNVIFARNTAEDFGGGVYNAFGGIPRFTNVVLSRNHAKNGGGMSNDAGTNPRLIYVTFSNNVATLTGGGIDNASGSNPVLVNCVLWGNTAPAGAQIFNAGSTPIISYSDVQASGGSGSWNPALGTNGGNNIDANPLFVEAAYDNAHTGPGSPAGNVGRNSAVPPEVTTDLDGKPRIVTTTVDMGAYEFQTAPTLFATPNPMFFQSTCDTITLINVGGTTLTISGINGCSTPPHAIDTSMTAHTLLSGASTMLRVCVVPPAGIDTCTISIVSNASNTPTQVMVILDVLTAVGPEHLPKPFRIVSVAPNPFNPSTTVFFTLPAPMPVTTEIWSVTGARVRTLTNERIYGAGDNNVTWDGRNDQGSTVASGVYFVRVKTRLGLRVTRAVLLK